MREHIHELPAAGERLWDQSITIIIIFDSYWWLSWNKLFNLSQWAEYTNARIMQRHWWDEVGQPWWAWSKLSSLLSMQNSLLGYSVVTVHDYRLVPETECVCLLQGEPHEEGKWNINADCRERGKFIITLQPNKICCLGENHVFRTSQTVVWSTSCVVYRPQRFLQPLGRALRNTVCPHNGRSIELAAETNEHFNTALKIHPPLPYLCRTVPVDVSITDTLLTVCLSHYL